MGNYEICLNWLQHHIFCLSPLCPEVMDWSKFYPKYFKSKETDIDEPSQKKFKTEGYKVEFADIGCGYGGLLGKNHTVVVSFAVTKSLEF